jgi:cell division protein FtsB
MSLRRNVLAWAIFIAAALAALSVADAGGFRRYLTLRRESAVLEEKNQKLMQQNAELLREVEAMRKDPAAQERAAREELGYIKPGEVIIHLE